MPRGKRTIEIRNERGRNSANVTENMVPFDMNMSSDSEDGAGDGAAEKAPPSASKNQVVTEDGDSINDFGNEMQKMLECFGADITKTLSGKKKRVEQFTQGAFKTSTKIFEDLWKSQCDERKKLQEEFSKQVTSVFGQWEKDIDKTKDDSDKLASYFRQQQKIFQQTRLVQQQRLRTIQQLYEEFHKGCGQLEKYHTEQQEGARGQLKKEMTSLQKNILLDTQKQEMATFKKSLSSMLC